MRGAVRGNQTPLRRTVPACEYSTGHKSNRDRNNEGSLTFSYNLEDTDHTPSGADIFNGQQSVLWNNLRDTFGPELRAMYQELRSRGILSYEVVERMFEDHQAKWPESIFNEDSWFKYLAPLEEDNNASYLSMLQGSKASQRKWWLYNRFRYMDSKYNAGDALTDVITVRGYAKSNIMITPYADVYAVVKYGSYLVSSRATRGVATTLVCPLSNVNDTEIMIFSASQLASVGDLSGLKVGYADFTNAVKLQNLVLGRSNEGVSPSSSAWYNNGNLQTLYLGNNTLLQSIDVRNCSGLGTGDQTTVDISGCTNVRAVLFEGTNITGITLPDGGVLQTLHLPGTITILKVLNQTRLSDFTCPDTTHISTLWLDNVSDAIDAPTIIGTMASGSRVRLFNFSWEMTKAHDLTDFMDRLDTMRGLDQLGNNTPTAQVYGTIHVPLVSAWLLSETALRYPDLSITYDTMGRTVLYLDYDGTLIDYEVVETGADAVGDLTPTRASSNTTVYTFDGWAVTQGGPVESTALENITEQKSVYAHYAESTRYYRVRFYNGAVLADTQYVAYGGYAVYYDSATGSSTPTYNGIGDPIDYSFTGWDKDISNITADLDTNAVYAYTPSYTRHYLMNTLTEYADQNNLTDLGPFAFAGNTQLSVLSMPELSFQETHTVPEFCFARLSNISSFTFCGDWDQITTVEDRAFWYFLSSNRMRDAGNNIVPYTMLFENATSLGDYAFAYTGQTHLFFPRVTTVGVYGFYQSYAKTLILPWVSTVGSSSDSIYGYMRMIETLKWSRITGTSTPTSVLSSQSYSTLAILDCGSITRLNAHMRNFTGLTDVIFRSTTVVTFSSSSVYSSGVFAATSPIGQGTGHIYVPSALVSSYKAANGWRNYEGVITAIEGSDYELT